MITVALDGRFVVAFVRVYHRPMWQLGFGSVSGF